MLSDGPGGLSCPVWGNQGDDRIPIIINDYEHDHAFGDWFGITWSSPWYLIIDTDFVFRYQTQIESQAEEYLEEILENME